MSRTPSLLLALPALLAVSTQAQERTAPVLAPHRPEISTQSDYAAFKSRFITARGRVTDTGNGFISHSEGQGYGMLFAVVQNDRETFERLWKWTREQLRVRGDALFAWRWIPTPYGGFVDDPNNATDGDLLIAWALLHAGKRWRVPEYAKESAAILTDIEKHLIVERDGRLALLPATAGFVGERGVTINLSYYVFPALADFARHDNRPGAPWRRLIDDGLALLREARFGEHRLPADWILLGDTMTPVKTDAFGNDAIRIPLYLAWYRPDAEELDPFLDLWDTEAFRRNPVPVVALTKTAVTESPLSPGAVKLVNAAGMLRRGPAWKPIGTPAAESAMKQDYYSAALGILARLARETHNPRKLPAGSLYDR